MRPVLGRPAYAALTLAIIGAGLLCRWPPLGLPWPVAKYAGSGLWGAMAYCGLRLINPRVAISADLAAACIIAVAVEMLRLVHQSDLDAFRATLAGRLLLGSHFSLWNLAAYGAGISGAALLDGLRHGAVWPRGNRRGRMCEETHGRRVALLS